MFKAIQTKHKTKEITQWSIIEDNPDKTMGYSHNYRLTWTKLSIVFPGSWQASSRNQNIERLSHNPKDAQIPPAKGLGRKKIFFPSLPHLSTPTPLFSHSLISTWPVSLPFLSAQTTSHRKSLGGIWNIFLAHRTTEKGDFLIFLLERKNL